MFRFRYDYDKVRDLFVNNKIFLHFFERRKILCRLFLTRIDIWVCVSFDM